MGAWVVVAAGRLDEQGKQETNRWEAAIGLNECDYKE